MTYKMIFVKEKNQPITEFKEPEEILAHFVEAWNNRDATQLAAIFSKDADFINVVGIWWQNQEDIRDAHDYGLREIFNESELRQGKTKIKMLSENAAVIHVRMRLTGQTPIGETKTQTRNTIFTFVIQRDTAESDWKCISAQNTDIVPGKETHIMESGGSLKPADYRKSKP